MFTYDGVTGEHLSIIFSLRWHTDVLNQKCVGSKDQHTNTINVQKHFTTSQFTIFSNFNHLTPPNSTHTFQASWLFVCKFQEHATLSSLSRKRKLHSWVNRIINLLVTRSRCKIHGILRLKTSTLWFVPEIWSNKQDVKRARASDLLKFGLLCMVYMKEFAGFNTGLSVGQWMVLLESSAQERKFWGCDKGRC